MSVEVCTDCGMIRLHGGSCVICDNKDFEISKLPSSLKCEVCGIRKKLIDILKEYNEPPFYRRNTGTYYCGCRGFE